MKDTMETYDLEKSQVCVTYMVKGDLGVDPGKVFGSTLPLVGNLRDVETNIVIVDTFVELPTEELDAHDGEDEPEDETHEEHVEDGGDGVHQSIDNNLKLIYELNYLL